MADGTGTTVDQPTTLILTEAGTSHFVRRNQRLSRFRLLNGRDEYGLLLRNYDVGILDRLLSGGLVRRIQYRVADVFNERTAISRFITSATSGILSLSCNHHMHRELARSSLVRQWNRTRPSTPLGSPEARTVMSRILTDRPHEEAEIKSLVQARVRTRLRAQTGGTWSEDSLETRLEQCLAHVPHEVWFFLMTGMSKPGGTELLAGVLDKAIQMIARFELADYLALVWIELITHLQTAVAGEDRSEVGLLIELSGAGVGGDAVSELHRIHMIAAGGDRQMRLLKANLDELSDTSGAGSRSMEQFYKSAGTGQSNLGLHYLNFLEDACRRKDVGFRSFVHGDGKDGTMSVVMTI